LLGIKLFAAGAEDAFYQQINLLMQERDLLP